MGLLNKINYMLCIRKKSVYKKVFLLKTLKTKLNINITEPQQREKSGKDIDNPGKCSHPESDIYKRRPKNYKILKHTKI